MVFEEERNRMVELQIKARGIKDKKVLDALLKVERHRFVPDGLLSESYSDYPLPIGNGQTISQPYIVALMTESLELKGREKVLEVGTGSGYQTAILAKIASNVVSVEKIGVLSKRAKENLKNYSNVKLIVGDGKKGNFNDAPYDGIIVTAAALSIPSKLISQLKDEGRMVIPIGVTDQELVSVEKKGEELVKKSICHVRFVPLV